MNSSIARLWPLALLCAAALALPSAELRSQGPVPPDLVNQLRALGQRNEEILKKQEEQIKVLDELIQEARDAKAFSKRG